MCYHDEVQCITPQNTPHINQAAAPQQQGIKQQQGMAVNLPPPIQISSPPPLKSTSPEDWNMFKVMWDNYAVISQINRQAPDYRKAAFLHVIGPKGLQIYNNITYNLGEDENDVTLIIEKLENLIVGQTNVIYERYVFNNRNQRDDENIDSYVAELRRLSKTCQFCECLQSSLIRDRLVIGIRDGATRKYLLQKRDLTLDNAIDICRGSEATAAHLKGIGGAEAEKVNKLHASGKFQSRKRQNRKGKSHSEKMNEKKEVMCKFCGRNHELKRKLCPAWGRKCSTCQQYNHFSSMCKSKSVYQVDDTDEYSSSDYEIVPSITMDDDLEIVNAVMSSKDIHAKMMIHDNPVVFQVDSGASINILPMKYLQHESIETTSKKLQMWNGSIVKPVGTTCVKMKNAKTHKKYKVSFIIVNDDFKPILGKRASESMNLIKINYDEFESVNITEEKMPSSDYIKEFSDVFDQDAVGNLPGNVKLVLMDEYTPTEMPPRRVPIAIKDDLKKELDSLVSKGVLKPTEKPTSWVSQMSVQQKKD